MQRFDKRDVATELLDAAITEYLDHARHFAAYNLAAVSEELTSNMLRLRGRIHSTGLKFGALKAMTEVLRQIPPGDRVWWRELFRLKNTIKHMDGGADRFFDANIENNARQKIGDAIANAERLGITKSSQVKRFDVHRFDLHARHLGNPGRESERDCSDAESKLPQSKPASPT